MPLVNLSHKVLIKYMNIFRSNIMCAWVRLFFTQMWDCDIDIDQIVQL